MFLYVFPLPNEPNRLYFISEKIHIGLLMVYGYLIKNSSPGMGLSYLIMFEKFKDSK